MGGQTHVMECYKITHQQQSRGCSHTVHLNVLARAWCNQITDIISIFLSHIKHSWYLVSVPLSKVQFQILLNVKGTGQGNTCPTQSKDIDLPILQLYGMNSEWILVFERQSTSICTLLSHGRNCKTWVSLQQMTPPSHWTVKEWLPQSNENIPYTIKVYRQLSYHHRQFKK